MLYAHVMRWIRCCIICLPVSVCFIPDIVRALQEPPPPVVIGVVYPEVGKPYQDVIDSIIQGIRRQPDSSIELYALRGDSAGAGVGDWLISRKIAVVIGLGKQGLEATDKLPGGVKRILGALLSPPPADNGLSYAGGISLAPDPEIVFRRIRALSPKTRRVIVVYDPASNEWLIDLAKPAASQHGLELLPLPAKDLREAAAIYTELREKGLGRKDLIWLLNDPGTVDQNTVLPFLLKTSWSDEFAVISNNPAHVKRGVLFSLYPDYAGMGESLGRLSFQTALNGASPDAGSKSILPLRDVLIAVNVRTAEHLNLVYTQKEKEAFDLVFPESR